MLWAVEGLSEKEAKSICPGWDLAAEPGVDLGFNRGLKGALITDCSIEVVGTETEGVSAGYSENPFHRLGFDFNRFKFFLFGFITTVGLVPVSEIYQAATFLSRDAPVCEFVHGACEITMGKDDLCRGPCFRDR